MKKAPDPREETEEKKRRWALLPLLLVLLFLLLATSCIVGFRLGRTTDLERLGTLIDTIVLAPQPVPAAPAPPAGEVSGPEQREETVCLLGVVRYTDGTPFTQGAVELRSTPRLSELDEAGRFRFDDVETGGHTLTVLDAQGNPLTSESVQVLRDAETDAYMEYRQELCVLHIRLLTVQVNVELIMEEGPDGELEIRLVDTLEEDEPAPQPSAPSPAETDGQRPGGPSEPSQTPAVATGETPTATPTATPDVTPATTPAAVPTATPTPAAAVSPSAVPTPSPSVSPSPTPTATPSPTPSTSSRPTRRPVRPGSTVTPTPTAAPSPTATPGPSGETGVYHGESGQSWTQQAEVDLFRPLDGSAERLIAPGSQGYYLFRLENGRTGKVRFTLAVREGSFHVPLEFRITDGKDPMKELSPWRTASLEAEMVSEALELEPGENGYYRIEWRWPFDGDDAADTALGTGTDRTYTLKLTLRAEDAL